MISRGEKKIIQLLNQNRIKFEKEKIFEDLKGFKNKPLRFDFAIYHNGQLQLLLDVDGRQHFTYTKFFQKDYSDFLKQKEYDRKKNSYCLRKQIPFVRIPFWAIGDITITDILFNKTYRVNSVYFNDLLWREKKQNGKFY